MSSAPLRAGACLRASWRLSALAALLGAASLASHPAQAEGASHAARVLYPVGGAYDTAMLGYAKEVARHAQGAAVRIVVVPAAFADDPVLPEDPGILAEDVAAIQAACDAVLNKQRFPQGCQVSSVPLYVAGDASAPAIVSALADPALNGVFFTGGDQAYAMRILANTPAESTLHQAAQRGVVVGGTSAGAAIQSYVMNAGYTDAGDSTTGLQKGAIDMWLGPLGAALWQRGLSFASRQLVIDEHVFSRGRMGRMLNASAQTVDAMGHGGLLGLGFDYDTGGALRADRWLSNVSGVSAGLIVDFRSAGARHSWRGAQQALSARHVLTHLLPPSPALGFDVVARVPMLAGQRLAWRGPAPAPQPWGNASRATLVLGGDVSQDLGGPVIKEVVRLASRASAGVNAASRSIVLVTAAYADQEAAQADALAYQQALVQAGWRGSVRVLGQVGGGALDASQLKSAAGVILLGGDQALLPAALADTGLQNLVRNAAMSAEVLMLDHAMTAAAGSHYDAVPDADSADDAIAAFKAGSAIIKPGLGLIRGAAFEPRLQADKRWGRLYGIGERQKQLSVLGISEGSALLIQGRQARVLGPNPVVALDARRATFVKGDNGALGAFNVLLDVYESGELID